MSHLLRIRYILVLAFMTLAVSLGNPVTDVDAATNLKVHFIDVGQGDATLIQYGKSYSLMDTGIESNYPKLKTYIEKIGVSKISLKLVYEGDILVETNVVFY